MQHLTNAHPEGFAFLSWNEVGVGVLRQAPERSAGLERLSERERALFCALPEHRQSEWLRGRHVCKQLAGELWGPECPPHHVEVLPGVHGEPRLHGPGGLAALDVSLSHARGLSVAAMTASGQVGVDVEPVAPIAERLWHLFLTPAERTRCAREPELAQRLWLLKEALYKALRPPEPVPLRSLEPELGEGMLRLRQPVSREFAFTFLSLPQHLLAVVRS
jgi:4'-phosphopantetheinyl transferase